MLRGAELFLNAARTQGLRAGDVRITPGRHVELFIQSMKNDSYARGHTVPLAWESGSGVAIGATVTRYAIRLRECGVLDHEAFFCPATEVGFRPPGQGKTFSNTDILRTGLAKIYLEFRDPSFAARFSWHSLRRGGCQWAMRQGVGEDLVRGHGIWSLQGMQPYLGADRAERLSVTLRM